MRKIRISLIASLLLFGLCAQPFALAAETPKSGRGKEPVDYVDPFIGTDIYSEEGAMGEANTFPGAALPHGMVQLSPDTGRHIAGYMYRDKHIEGFSYTHLSGTGCWGLGSFLTMPMTGELKTTESGYRSAFRHETETATPGYYAVTLDDYGIRAEVTATTRTGFSRFTFPESENSRILFDVSHTLEDEPVSGGEVRILNNTTLVGSQVNPKPFCGGQTPYTVYFAAKFSKPFKSYGTWNGRQVSEGSNFASGNDIGAFVNYSTRQGERILVKVGISYVSEEQAMKNLNAEVPHWNFGKVRADARNIWNQKLGTIEVRDENEENKVKFYTGLYHALLGPYTFSDVDGKYMGFDNKVHTAKGYTQYHTFSLWDTFRAAHPLYNLVEPEEQNDFIKSLLANYEEGGWLPRWPMVNRYTNCMISDHAVSVIAESIMKDIGDFDRQKAYEAILKGATQLPPPEHDFNGRSGLKEYERYGYIPYDTDWGGWGSVSTTLEDAYVDWTIAQVAKKLGKEKDYRRFVERAFHYKNLYDPETGFMRPRKADGDWREPFDPREWNEFVEGNSWSYTFFVPHDVRGLMQLMGRDTFRKRLDHIFSAFIYPAWNEKFSQYWHGNEPDQHYAYLFNYAGQPWKTQKYTRKIMDELYGTGPNGIPGNEDVGQLSAWFVLSAMGFYPVAPAQATYQIGSPLFDEVIIHLPEYHYGGKDFVIKRLGHEDGPYIQTARLNGKPLRGPWFRHQDLADGGSLTFVMGPKPNKKWGSDPKDAPPSMTAENPSFVYTSLEVSKTEAEAHEPFQVKVRVKNRGGIGVKEIPLYVDGKRVQSKKAVIGPDSSETVVFTLRLYHPGKHEITIDSSSLRREVTIAPKPAAFEYSDLKVDHDGKSDHVTAEAKVQNIGSYEKTQDVDLIVDGQKAQSRPITLGPGETRTVVFHHTFDNNGEFQIRIGDTPPRKVGIPGVIGLLKPVLSLRFDEPDGDIARDDSGFGHDGTLKGNPERVPGRHGQALRLDGDDWVEVPHSDRLNASDELTLMAWVQLENPAADQKIVGKTSIGNGYVLGVQNNGLYPEVWDADSSRHTFTKGSIPAGEWVHLAVTWEKGGEMIGYINGEPIERVPTGDHPIAPNNYPLRIGISPWDSNSFPVRGMIDEVQIFQKALSQEAVQDLYRNNRFTGEHSHTTEWRDLQKPTSLKELQAVADVGERESVTAIVQVSEDGNRVLDEIEFRLESGSKSYDLSSLHPARYVRIKTVLEGESPFLDDYRITGDGISEEWKTYTHWKEGTWTPSVDPTYVKIPPKNQ
ncbi:putative alpha-1,2-mannosidase [Planifilum fimeticola]|uniref:Putative alpha-1,2-mannosidase n=1 Tax=Planifilum fimeticola TaxID=201975 RepID=A0A2T0LG60_9BACL|nr:GH92 family glycosyl hydrolase [Planifilum fimeticola]PRX41253.1 putative alpha-1,2-mannosidase [Planifilum fimeticola]